MSTTPAYLCPVHETACCALFPREPEHVWCHQCAHGYTWAAWSYQEVTGAICLEMMYQKYVAAVRQQLQLAVDRENWIKIPMMEFLEPSMVVLALQAGVLFSSDRVMGQLQRQAQAEQLRRKLHRNHH